MLLVIKKQNIKIQMIGNTILLFLSILLLSSYTWILKRYALFEGDLATQLKIPIKGSIADYFLIDYVLSNILVSLLLTLFIVLAFLFFLQFPQIAFEKLGNIGLNVFPNVFFTCLSMNILFNSDIRHLQFSNINTVNLFIISATKGSQFPKFSVVQIVLLAIWISLMLHICFLQREHHEPYIQMRHKSIMTIIVATVGSFFLLAAFLVDFGGDWLVNTFGTFTMDKLLFQIQMPTQGTEDNIAISFIVEIIVPTFFGTLASWMLFKIIQNIIIIFSESCCVVRHYILCGIYVIVGIGLFLYNFNDFDNRFGFWDFIQTSRNPSMFIEDHYMDPRTVKLGFPENKRNLVYIYVESLETSPISSGMGGYFNEIVTPELELMAKTHLNFSNSNKIGGALQISNTGWTIGGMVAQTSGLPLIIPWIDGNSMNLYEKFLPRAYALGDILADEGYAQKLIVGSDADFAGRRPYFTQHGNYEVLDVFTAARDGIMPEGYGVWWGFEDWRLFNYAKKELRDLQQQQPFNLTLLTVDTHHIGGYLCKLCEKQYDDQLLNVYACASRQLDDFVQWVQQQGFYENTTIIIAGDHLSMDPFMALDGYNRTTLNIFINSLAIPESSKNRLFSTLDLFPTTLASMGVSIEGERLGLGTNLFSAEPTLIEKYGFEAVDQAMLEKSQFYDSLLH